jgi:uncharacterized protein YecE (DUF72 family)
MSLHVGTKTLHGDLATYARRFDLLELSGEPGKLPRPARLAQLRLEAPAGFVFSLVLPRALAELDSVEELERTLQHAIAAADAVSASWLLLRSEPSAMPSARTRRRLAERIGSLPRQGRRIAWEPRGLWEPSEAESFARELDVALVRDVSRDEPPPGAVLYTRLRALGRTGVSLDAIERVAEVVADFEHASVVIEGEGAVRAAKSLRALVGEFVSEDASDEALEPDREELA